MSRKPVNNFVVYAFYRDHDDRFGRYRTIYYIGKGRPNRPYQKSGRTIKRPEDVSFIEVLHRDLDENTAFEYERKLIEFYGRADIYPEWGILRNLTDGGDGVSGMIHSDETKKKMSNDRSGAKNSFYGKTHTEELKDSKRVHFDLYHPEYGEYKNTTFEEMRGIFPEIFINRSKVLNVANGISNSYKKWVLLKNKDANLLSKKASPLKNYFTWVHKEHGSHKNMSIVDLCKKFPDLNLVSSSLSLVSQGKQKYHKGWTIDKNPATSERGRRGKVYKWYHDEHGEHILTPSELVKKYKEQKLQPSSLSWVINKKASHHKGWVLIE